MVGVFQALATAAGLANTHASKLTILLVDQEQPSGDQSTRIETISWYACWMCQLPMQFLLQLQDTVAFAFTFYVLIVWHSHLVEGRLGTVARHLKESGFDPEQVAFQEISLASEETHNSSVVVGKGNKLHPYTTQTRALSAGVCTRACQPCTTLKCRLCRNCLNTGS